MGLDAFHEGKNIETVLVGRVNHPVSEKIFQKEVSRSGIAGVREQLMRVLPYEMDRVRRDQSETNPSNPKSYFGKNLLADLDEALGNLGDIEDGRYELRFYSAKDTFLDYAGSFDCWAEIYDIKDSKILADFKIDVTTNPNKNAPRRLADAVLFCDQRYVNDELPGRIEKAFFRDPEYKAIVRMASESLRAHANIPFSN